MQGTSDVAEAALVAPERKREHSHTTGRVQAGRKLITAELS